MLPALLAAYPQARVTLVGKAWHAAFLHGRGVVDEVVVLPSIPGVGAPPDVPQAPDDAAATTRLCDALRARRFDLARQLHGGGRFSNPFLARLAGPRPIRPPAARMRVGSARGLLYRCARPIRGRARVRLSFPDLDLAARFW
jgi:ADP-heptose:LPS heptosyltransferase